MEKLLNLFCEENMRVMVWVKSKVRIEKLTKMNTYL